VRRSPLFTPLFDLLFLLVVSGYILAGTALVPFHGDEATQVYMSRDYAYQFMQRDLAQVRYGDPPASAQEQELRLLNGTVNKYSIGLAWHLAGFSIEDINEQWDWGADYDYNVRTGHAPSEALLRVSRIPSAVLLCAAAAALYGIGLLLGGRGAAVLAVLLFALSPNVLINGRRAMMEGSFLAFTLLAVLAALVWAEAQSWRRRMSFGALLGLSAGVALASKHTAVFVLAPLGLVCGVIALVPLLRGKGRERFHTLASLLLAGVVAAGVFYALNPAWWGDPAARIGYVLDMRQRMLAGQTAAFGGYADAGAAVAGFFRQVFIGLPQHYDVAGWENFIGGQIAAYEASPWRGISIGGSIIGGIALNLVCLVGLAVLALRRHLSLSARTIAVTWCAAALGSVLLFTPLEWARYYLPALPAVALLAGLGAAHLIRLLRRRTRGYSG
jgi:4-amino-4-deoxy-L-arabinose transferase-like glycosyltransferase